MRIRALDIANFLKRPLIGEDFDVTGPSGADHPSQGSVTFLKASAASFVPAINQRDTILVITEAAILNQITASRITSENPRMDFAKVVQEFFVDRPEPGIALTAVVHPSASIGRNVSIGQYSVIATGSVVGDGTTIHNHVVIGPRTVIGKGCVIKSNTVVGEECLGLEFEADGTPVRMPQVGRVVIGNNVEIGALNAISRGTIGDTTLANNVKTDDHVYIAHNVSVGENSVIISGAQISGSVRIGRNAWIAPQATITNKVEIGDGSFVGIGAVVIRSVEPNVIVVGNPARVLRKRS